MSIMSIFRRKEKRAEDPQGTVQFESGLLSALIGGKATIDKASALEIPTVQSCIELLAGIVASLPLKLYEEKDGKVTEIKGDIRTSLINGKTGDVINGSELRRLWVRDYFLGKGSYTYIDRDIYAVPKGLYYVDESRVSVYAGIDPIFKDYSIAVNGAAYTKSDFIKILRNSKGNGRGTSVIEENPSMLLTAYNTMKYENSVVKKGGNKRGFFTSQNQQSKESMQDIKNSWRKMFSNSLDVEDNILVLNAGMDFKEASATALEMQLNENKRTNADEICKLFGVPAELLAGKASEQVRENFISDSVMPLLNMIEAALDSDMLYEWERGNCYFAFDTRELTRGNILKRYNAYAVGLQNGFLQFDDVRELEDLEPLDFPYIKLGLNDVLYNPATKEIYTPNTNALVNLGEASGMLEDKGLTGEEVRGRKYIQDPKTGLMQGSEADGETKNKSNTDNKDYLTKVERRGILEDKINSGELPLKIREQKQNTHRKGTNQYKEGNSYVTVDNKELQKIVDKKHTTGTIYVINNGAHIRERVQCDKIIGVNVDPKKNISEETSNATIHYSKKGTHVVPAHGREKEK